MEGIWTVAFATVVVIGVGVATLGGVVLEGAIPFLRKLAERRLNLVDVPAIEDLHLRLDEANREVARLHSVETKVERLQEQVDFLEGMLTPPKRSSTD